MTILKEADQKAPRSILRCPPTAASQPWGGCLDLWGEAIAAADVVLSQLWVQEVPHAHAHAQTHACTGMRQCCVPAGHTLRSLGQRDKDGFVFSSATSFRLLNAPGCWWSGWIPNSENFPQVKERYSYSEARARLNPDRGILHMRGASGIHLALDTLWIAFFC